MKINGQEISKEFMAKALQCDTPEDLMALAKKEGIEITAKQAEEYLAKMEDIELSSEQLKAVAGGTEWHEKLWDDFWKKG